MNRRDRFAAGAMWLHEAEFIEPGWLWLLIAKMWPGVCSKCYHRHHLHMPTCDKLKKNPEKNWTNRG